ncbi:MAG: hypothetical protein ACOYO1_17770 [Bacteroidales bacterium]
MEEIQNNSEPIINQPKQRPQILSVFCVLTFIWSGLVFINNLTCALLYNTLKENISTIKLPSIYEEMRPAMLQLFSNGRLFFVAGFLLSFFSLFGAIKMWKLQKKGFHIYTISQIILLMLPLIFIKGAGVQSIEFLITAFFVLMYSMHLKIMD